jgi:hypothetical protein
MSDAPERIWAARGLYTAHLDNRWPTPVEYIRADASDAALANAVEGLWWFAEGRFLNSGREPRECLQSVIYKARATLAEIEGSNDP